MHTMSVKLAKQEAVCGISDVVFSCVSMKINYLSAAQSWCRYQRQSCVGRWPAASVALLLVPLQLRLPCPSVTNTDWTWL